MGTTVGTTMGTRSVIEALAEAAGAAGTLTVIGGRHDASASSGAVVSWAALHDRARRIASALQRQGVSRGSRVGILGDTNAGVVTALQAVWLSGAAVTMLPPSRSANLTAVVADGRLDLLIANRDAHRVNTTRLLTLSDVDHLATTEEPCELVAPDPADLAILQYTSGSTGRPRGVPVTHAHLAANLEAIKGAFQVGAGATAVRMGSWLPLYHDMGLIGFLALPMSCGWPLVLQTPTGFAMRPMSWFEAISRYRITTTAAPNFAYRLMTQLLEAGAEVDLSSVRFMLSGGEPIDAAAMARFTDAASTYGLNPGAIVPAYGLAEATLAVTVSAPGAGLRLDRADGRELVRLGRALPGTQIKIVDSEGKQLAEREVGRIQVQGPSVVGHYWGTPPPPPESWLDTGDLGYLVEGELVVCGRHKEVLFAAGRNVYPQDVEAAAAHIPGIRPGGIVAFGIPGDHGDRLVVAVESRVVDAQQLRRSVAAAIVAGVGMTPAEVVALTPGRLPKTSSGKLRRAEASAATYVANSFPRSPILLDHR